MILSFRIQGKVLTKVNYQDPTKVSNMYKCRFYFDEKTWKGLEIFAVFINNVDNSKIVPLGKYTESMSCVLPNHVRRSKYFKMFVYAKNRFQTNTITVIPSKTCKTQTKKTTALTDILEKLNQKIDNVIYDENQLKCFADGTLVDTIYIDNVDKIIIDEQVQKSLESFKQEVNQRIDECVKVDDISFENGIISFR